MLQLDRYLVTTSRTLDVSTGRPVRIDCVRPPAPGAALFTMRGGRTLIDTDASPDGRVEVWEQWAAPRVAVGFTRALDDFIEALDVAALGVPRRFDLGGTDDERALLSRACAREARVHGWIPVGVELLGALTHRPRPALPSWTVDRSLVVFAAPSISAHAAAALRLLAGRDLRPHIIVQPSHPARRRAWYRPAATARAGVTARERPRTTALDANTPALLDECRARWAVLIDECTDGPRASTSMADLARVLSARGRAFEAHAWATRLAARGDESGVVLLGRLENRAGERARHLLTGSAQADGGSGMEIVDDFVGVLQVCQDTEDEHTALARVGAYLRERLQASSVAFVVREGPHPRVLARVGADHAPVDLALRTMESACPSPPASVYGPTEAAHPVRHASEIIGAVWCRWSAGTPVADHHAATLLGVVAAATAPSLRLAAARAPAVPSAGSVPELVGESPVMAAVRDAIVRAAASPFPVVIEGESGSGKELAARAIHTRSPRADRRFCPINCAALIDDLVEAELFGHVRGAYTGATADRAGMFEDAHRGTLFLDEVAELSARVQAKLLRVLQEGEVRRLGESVVRKVDVRVVAATNRPLAQEVAGGRFRADLWYRLDVIRITLPPLRERLEDLPSLIAHLWRGLATRTGSRAALTQAAVGVLGQYDWPGNIRELQNVLASLLVSAPRGGVIGPGALPSHVARAATMGSTATLAEARRQFDERFVRAALARTGGRTAPAARALGLSRQGLAKLMERLGIVDRPLPVESTRG